MGDLLVRYRSPNKDTLFVQKRTLNVITFAPYLLSRMLISVFTNRDNTIPDWIWVDWTDLKNPIHVIDEEMNWHASELERLKTERKAAEDLIKVEIKTLEGDFNETRGYSRPFKISQEKLGPIGLKLQSPGQAWKKILSSKFLGNGRKTASGKDFNEGSIPGGFKTTYAPDDFSQHALALGEVARENGSDGLVMYKDQKQQKGKGGGSNGNFNPSNRKKQKGESPEGHRDRLEAINNGTDVSNWTPY